MKLPYLAVLLLVPWPCLPVAGFQPPAGQDWVVTEDLSVSNETISLGIRNLTVRSGARLTLDNVSLSFDQADEFRSGITVETGAALRLVGCAINPGPAATRAYFKVFGELDAERTRIDSIGRSSDTGQGGINVLGGKASFRESVLNDTAASGEHALVCLKSTIVLEDTRLAGKNSQGLYCYFCSVSIQNCTNEATFGVESIGSNITVLGSRFSPNTDCAFYSSRAVISGCDFGSVDGRDGRFRAEPRSEPGVNLTIQDCVFNGYTGCFLARDWTSLPASYLSFEKPVETVVSGCSFGGAANGISADYAPGTVIEGCTFDCQNYAIVGIGFTYEDLTVRKNSILRGYGISLPYGGGLVENNTLRSGNNPEGGMIDCQSKARILNNTISGPGAQAGRTYGIRFADISDGGPSEIRGNSVWGMRYGIHYQGHNIENTVSQNRVTGCDAGVTVYGCAAVLDNSIESRADGIVLNGYGEGLAWRVAGNDIASNGTGINLTGMRDPTGDGAVTGNTLRGGWTGIHVRSSDVAISRNRILGPADTGIRAEEYTGDLVENKVTAGDTGIRVRFFSEKHDPGSVRSNTVDGARRGIAVERTDARVESNLLTNISGCGIFGQDYTGNSTGNTFGSAAFDPRSTCREVRMWSVRVSARYNANPPGEPESWRSADKFHLLVTDRLGDTVSDDPAYVGQTLTLKGAQTWWNGTERDPNPHRFAALCDLKGAGWRAEDVNRPLVTEITLRTGPELHPFSLEITPVAPVEGELVQFFAVGVHNATFNPNHLPAPWTVIELSLDGTRLAAKELPECLAGYSFGVWAAAVATPGWHNVSFLVDSTHVIDEIFEDNNMMSCSFFVTAMPDAVLESDGTESGCWEAVTFSVRCERSAEALAGVRFDFGDGNETEWSAALCATHVYTSRGQYTVRAWVVNREGTVRECKNALSVNITAPALEARILAFPDPAPSGQPVLFTVELTGPADRVVSGIWYFGDGGSGFSDRRLSAEHLYGHPGNYTVRLTVVMEDGTGLNFSMLLEVQNARPEASGEVMPQNGTASTLFAFRSSSTDSDGQIVRTRWEFGDGAISDLPAAAHYYSRHGRFAANLTVQDDLGWWSAPASFSVTVENTPPVARLGTPGGRAVPGSRLSFDGSATTDIDDPPESLSYSWDFGDGSSAAGVRASHAYARAGRYTVTLTVDDGAGGVSARTAVVEVRDAAGPGIGWQLPAAVAGALLAVSIVIYIIIRILSHRHGEHGPRRDGARPEVPGGKKRPPKVRF